MDGTLIETNNNHVLEDEAYEPTYAEAFPPLCPEEGQTTPIQGAPKWQNTNNTNVWKNKLALKSSVVTQVIEAGLFLYVNEIIIVAAVML